MPYWVAASPGRRRGEAASTVKPREEERASPEPNFCGGILREEEGGCRLNPDPREEEGVGYRYSLLRTPGGFVSHAADVRAAHAEVGEVAVGQIVQFAQGLAIDRTAGHVITGVGDEFRDATVASFVAGGALVQYENSHFIYSSSCGFAAGRIACRFVRANMVRFLRLHNGAW